MEPTQGTRLKAVRKAARISQEEMARRFGQAKASICRYESDDATVSVERMLQWAAHCKWGTDVAQWIGFGGKAPNKAIGNALRELLEEARIRAAKKGAA